MIRQLFAPVCFIVIGVSGMIADGTWLVHTFDAVTFVCAVVWACSVYAAQPRD